MKRCTCTYIVTVSLCHNAMYYMCFLLSVGTLPVPEPTTIQFTTTTESHRHTRPKKGKNYYIVYSEKQHKCKHKDMFMCDDILQKFVKETLTRAKSIYYIYMKYVIKISNEKPNLKYFKFDQDANKTIYHFTTPIFMLRPYNEKYNFVHC